MIRRHRDAADVGEDIARLHARRLRGAVGGDLLHHDAAGRRRAGREPDERAGDDLAMEGEPRLREDGLIRERITAVDVAAIERVDVGHPGPAQLAQEIGRRESLVLAVVARVQRPHHLVEIVRVIGRVADRDVEQEAEQRPLGIVELRAVDVDLVDPRRLTAILDAPGFGGLLHLVHVGDGIREELVGRPQPRPQVGEIGIVVSHTLRPPQQRRVLFGVIVVRPHLGGADALHVPQMEKLVRQERVHEVAEVAGRIGKGERGHDVVLRGAVLEPAAEVDRSMNDVEEDRVHVVRCVAHDPVLDRRHLRHAVAEVARDRGRVIGRRPHRDANPLPVRLQ